MAGYVLSVSTINGHQSYAGELLSEKFSTKSIPNLSRILITMTYKIVLFNYPNCFKPVKTIRRGLTLEQAQEHCSRPDTKGGEGESAWFHGYEKE